ncbi:hypothetical protein R1sor_013664 [Riccia sorocarpa]|uniref:Uncharacterized protein n=1 Tax=Riccia sorocarpa TaxID=122646 RepID=A0ABD3HAF6_9MARC
MIGDPNTVLMETELPERLPEDVHIILEQTTPVKKKSWADMVEDEEMQAGESRKGRFEKDVNHTPDRGNVPKQRVYGKQEDQTETSSSKHSSGENSQQSREQKWTSGNKLERMGIGGQSSGYTSVARTLEVKVGGTQLGKTLDSIMPGATIIVDENREGIGDAVLLLDKRLQVVDKGVDQWKRSSSMGSD